MGQPQSLPAVTFETSYLKSSQSKALVGKSSTSRPEVVEGSCVFNGSKVEGWYVDKDKGVCVESNSSTGSLVNSGVSSSALEKPTSNTSMGSAVSSSGSMSVSNVGMVSKKENPFMCMPNPMNDGYEICVESRPRTNKPTQPTQQPTIVGGKIEGDTDQPKFYSSINPVKPGF